MLQHRPTPKETMSVGLPIKPYLAKEELPAGRRFIDSPAAAPGARPEMEYGALLKFAKSS